MIVACISLLYINKLLVSFQYHRCFYARSTVFSLDFLNIDCNNLFNSASCNENDHKRKKAIAHSDKYFSRIECWEAEEWMIFWGTGETSFFDAKMETRKTNWDCMIGYAILIYIKSQLNENDEEAMLYASRVSFNPGRKKIGNAWNDGILIVIIDHYLEQLRLVFAIKCVSENIQPYHGRNIRWHATEKWNYQKFINTYGALVTVKSTPRREE